MHMRHLISFSFWAGFLIAPVLQAGTNPVPLINNPLSPESAAPGGPSFTLTVNGTGFVSGSAVNWNGKARATVFVSASQLTATILASDIAVAGTASVTVTSPAPGGGMSNVAFFQVIAPATAAALVESSYPLKATQVYVATGDLNGDGKLDLVVGSTATGAGGIIEVMLGNGDGTFQAPATFPTGATTPIAIADFNQDGKPDIAALNSNSTSGGISILLGNGDGTFQPYKIYPANDQPNSIAIGDFNADGKLDIAVAGTNVTVLLANGDGTFQAPVEYAAGTNPFSLITGDFNRDGHLDLIANSSSGIVLLLGNGDGSFQKPILITGPNGPLVTADFNGDGILDLAAANGADVYILLGNGDGTFKPPVAYAAGQSARSVVIGDFNGDGKVDLAMADYGTGTKPKGAITILLGNGDGTFQAPLATAAPGSPTSLATGDFNGDGRLDLTFTEYLTASRTADLSVALQTTASVSPAALAFPSILDGKTSAPEMLTVTDIGSAGLSISQVSLSGTNAEDFALTSDTCQGATVPPSGNCTIGVSFSPSAMGLRTATLAISDNAPASPQSVGITGTGTVVDLVPAALNFGQVKVGTISPEKLITVTNTATTIIPIGAIQVVGADPGDFLVSDTCGTSLNPKVSCSIVIQFIPTTKGTRTAAVAVGGNPGANPKNVPLSGVGT